MTTTAKPGQKTDFADRLKAAIERKGWSMSETARRASNFLSEGDKFGRAHVWHYVQGRALPRVRYLEALSLALDVKPDELMPLEPGRNGNGSSSALSSATASSEERGRRPSPDKHAPAAASPQTSGMVHVRDYGDGTALLEVSERVPWDVALSVLQILKRNSGV
ncbi:MAG TPA: helix-turn-helix domain-containing protein [Microvirga sp.]|nr:helix-turn-helix domain-containing protein [Microvirga sp.]